jgi:[NiFe] hydrogenase assembly HybE family chaperone
VIAPGHPTALARAGDAPAGQAASADALGARVRALEALFRHVAATRMQGVPILHPRIEVEALGFEVAPDDGDRSAAGVGVLVTPWFMNLVWLPLDDDPARPPTPVGVVRRRAVGAAQFDFIGALEPGFGAYEACSLFSPMGEFADHGNARATGLEVLRQLREPAPEEGSIADTAAGRPATARRALLFGRAGAAPGA